MAEKINPNDIAVENGPIQIGDKIDPNDIATVYDDVPVTAHSNISKARSAALGAIQGTTLGYGDEIRGEFQSQIQKLSNILHIPIPDVTDMVAKGILKVGNTLTGSNNAQADVKWFKPGVDASKVYQQNRDEARQQNAQAQQANPVTYGASEAVGSVAPSLALPELKAAKGAGAFAKVTNAITNGALQGGVQAGGLSDQDSALGVAGDVAKGAAIGGALSGGIQGAVSGAKGAAGALKRSAEERAFKAAGGDLSAARALQKEGEDPHNIGRFMLDEGIVSPLGTNESMTSKLSGVSSAANKQLDDIHDLIDLGNHSKIDPNDLITQLEALKQNYSVDGSVQQQANNQLDKFIEMVKQTPTDSNGFLTAASARELRQAIDKNTNFNALTDSAAYLKNKAGRDARGAIKDKITSIADDSAVNADLISNPTTEALAKQVIPSNGKLSDSFKSANSKVKNSIEAEKLLDKQAAREAGNNFFGLTSNIAGISGAAAGFGAGGPIGSGIGYLTGLGLKKLSEKYGPGMSAVAMDKASNALSRVPDINIAPAANLLSKPLISSAIDSTQTKYMLPDDSTISSSTPDDMKGKPFGSIINVLNQTDPEFMRKSREQE